MKKLFVCAVMLCLALPLFVACAPSPEHKNLHAMWQEFALDEQYQQFYNGNIEFASSVSTEKNIPTSRYYPISYCEKMIKMSVQNIDQFKTLFLITPPKNHNSIHKVVVGAKNAIETFKGQVEKFNTEKAELDNIVSIYGTNHPASFSELDDLLRDIGILTCVANDMQKAYAHALETLYITIDRANYESALDVKASVCLVQSTLIGDAISYSIKAHNNTAPTATTPLDDCVFQLNNQIATSALTTDNEKYQKWLEFYRLFKNEETMFQNSLWKVNLNVGPAQYAGQEKVHYNKVVHYVDQNATNFVQKTISLLF